jgi:hypothetical protein
MQKRVVSILLYIALVISTDRSWAAVSANLGSARHSAESAGSAKLFCATTIWTGQSGESPINWTKDAPHPAAATGNDIGTNGSERLLPSAKKSERLIEQIPARVEDSSKNGEHILILGGPEAFAL